MKEIVLKNGGITLVDDEDFEALSQFAWLRTNHGYVIRYVGKTTIVRMHRAVMDLALDDRRCVDHINGNKLDNRKCNLRICTRAENNRNRGLNRNNTSGFRGVIWLKTDKRWEARIKSNGKTLYLGRFDTAEFAAEAYKIAAKELYGEFACFDR
jgi:hypothetical protein